VRLVPFVWEPGALSPFSHCVFVSASRAKLCASPGLQSGERVFKPARTLPPAMTGYLAAASISPGENTQFRGLNSRTRHRSHVLYQGTTLVGP
jgi:hypothetical protein